MREIICKDIFLLPSGKNEAICVPTNGVWKKDGLAVMGKDYTKEANELYKLDSKLGKYLKMYGNRAFFMGLYSGYGEKEHPVLTFPTKNKWWHETDISIIRKSAEEILLICNKRKITRCYIPKNAFGNLDYNKIIKPVLSNVLDDRFIIVFEQKEKQGK